jgi:hypothetical protein
MPLTKQVLERLMGFSMAKSNPKLEAKKPKSVFEKSIQVDLKGLFKSISKGIIHTASGKWEEVANDAVESLSAIGLATEPEELAFLLVRRSIVKRRRRTPLQAGGASEAPPHETRTR